MILNFDRETTRKNEIKIIHPIHLIKYQSNGSRTIQMARQE
jgi:hypothetical protein